MGGELTTTQIRVPQLKTTNGEYYFSCGTPIQKLPSGEENARKYYDYRISRRSETP